MRLTPAWLLLLAGASTAPIWASAASHLYRLGEKAELAGRIAQAYLYYNQAATADPKKVLYREKAEALAPLAALEAKVNPPDVGSEAKPDVTVAPLDGDGFDSITEQDLAAQRQMLPPVRLELPGGTKDYGFTGDRKALFEQLASVLDLRVVFDNDFQTGTRTKFALEGVSAREAIHALELATNSFVVPLSAKLVMVAQDTEQKRKELEQVETVSVPVRSVITAQDLTELGQALKQSVGVERVYWDAQTNEIVFNDRVSRVLAAQAVLQDLVAYRGQVAIELEFIELSETDMLQIGADLQTSFPVNFLTQALTGNTSAAASTLANTTVSVATLAQLAHFSLSQMFGLGIVNADVIATMNRSKGSNLLRVTLASLEGEKATFHSGQKYPIITSQFVGAATTGVQSYAPIPSFTFQDLGVVLTLTSHVHPAGEVSMDVDAEYKVLGATQANGIPIISSRKMTTTVRLKNNQWALVAGLTQDSTTRTLSGPAFFSNIPFLGHLISHFTRNKAKSYIVMAIKPRVLSGGFGRVTHEVYVGTQTKTVTPL